MDSPDERRKRLHSLLGRLPATPPDRRAPEGRRVETRETETYRLEKWALDLNGLEPVPAWHTVPLGATKRVPAVLYSHAHGGHFDIAKDEYIRGRGSLVAPPYAEALSRAGYAGICIDHWAFGERQRRPESRLFKDMLWRGQVLWGMMVHDTARALDWLVARPEVDPDRVAAMGLSMGSTMSWWIAALDERVRVCVDLCCLTDYEALAARDDFDLHGFYYYVPDLLTHFDTAGVNELIVPRPHLSLIGERDALTPLEGLDRIDARLRAAYANAGAPEAWRLSRYDVGHTETPAMRVEIMEWLARWL